MKEDTNKRETLISKKYKVSILVKVLDKRLTWLKAK